MFFFQFSRFQALHDQRQEFRIKFKNQQPKCHFWESFLRSIQPSTTSRCWSSAWLHQVRKSLPEASGSIGLTETWMVEIAGELRDRWDQELQWTEQPAIETWLKHSNVSNFDSLWVSKMLPFSFDPTVTHCLMLKQSDDAKPLGQPCLRRFWNLQNLERSKGCEAAWRLIFSLFGWP